MEMDDAKFRAIVADAIDQIPPQFAKLLENVVFLVVDEPSAEQLADADGEDLLGVYEGLAINDGDFFRVGVGEPNRIFIFKEPTLRMCNTEAEVAEEVLVTVFHEVAHHIGVSEDTLFELGWA